MPSMCLQNVDNFSAFYWRESATFATSLINLREVSFKAENKGI
jgi:hypothetical protein